MLVKRIIPCLDVKDGRVVKGKNFRNLKDAGDPVELAKYYYREGADELVFLDISASNEKRGMLLKLISEVARNIFIPFSVGGGIGSVEQIREALASGADKVTINTNAVNNPDFISQASRMFGSQCIVLAVDVKKISGDYKVYINGGEIKTDLDAVYWIREGIRRGAGEILLTSMDQDGTKQGYCVELTRIISDMVSVQVIASGGAGEINDFKEAIVDGKADAVLAASVFHYGEYTVKEVKDYLYQNNIPVRQV